MKVLASLLVAASMLAGCISSNHPSPPAKTTVVVPQNSEPARTTVVVPQNSGGTTVVCQDGTRPPCN